MPRIQFSDVTPPEKRSIRNIPIPNGGKRKTPLNVKPTTEPTPKVEPSPEISVPDIHSTPISKTPNVISNSAYEYYYPKNNNETDYGKNANKTRKRGWIFGGIIFLTIIAFVVGMMTIFASATINIEPRSKNIDVAMEIIGTNEMEEGSTKYEVVKLTKSKTVSIPATGEEAAEIKASGKIIVYNNFSSQPQRLIIRTRFETKEGLIYRIPESIVVPGKTTKNGVETPGSIEVEVFADEPGEKYNIDKTDFTVPGFKNDPERYSSFYARSVTEMTGGFVGKIKTVLPAEKQAALEAADLEIRQELLKELQSKIPDGLVLLTNSIVYKSKELAQKEESSSVLIGNEITAYALMLDKEELSNKITTKYISEAEDWNGIKPIITDFSPLIIEKIDGNLETGDKINLQIKGSITIWADIDTEIIRNKLLGAPKKNVQNIMDEFTGISSVTAVVRPIWKKTFPSNSSKIHVQTTINK